MSNTAFGVMRLLNFGPFEDVVFDWSTPGLTLVSGDNKDTTAASSNGSGKSHLFKGLLWILFGNTIEGDKYAEVIRNGQLKCLGVLQIQRGGDPWEIQRSRSKRSGDLKLFHSGKEVTTPSVKETQLLIEEIVGMDFRTFCSTVLYGQGDTKRFADPSTTDAERKVILKRVLRLDEIDVALEFVKGERNELQDKKTATEASANTLAQRRDLLADNHKRETETLAKIEKAISELVAKTTQIPEMRALLAEADTQVSGLESAKERLKEIQDKLGTAQRNSLEQNSEAVTHGQRARELHRQVMQFDDGLCPTCDTPTAEPSVRTKIGELKSELAQEETKRDRAAGLKAGYDTDIRNLERDIRSLTHSIGETEQVQKIAADVRVELATLEAADERKQELEREREETERRLDQVEVNLNSVKDDCREKAHELTEVTTELIHHEFWVEGFGNQGMPSQLLDSVVPELSEITNRYLGILTDGDITVEFDTETTLKSGQSRDKFSILVDIEGAGNVRPSGGQWRKITLAADLALMDLVARRERASVDVLLLDEALDGLDQVGQSRVVDLLMDLRTRRSSIFVVSHSQELSDIFDRTFVAIKENKVAKLEEAVV